MHTSRYCTCQCCVTAFHTPTFPVWLVATSWFPMKKRSSTGTPRLNTPGRVEDKRRVKSNPPDVPVWTLTTCFYNYNSVEKYMTPY